MEQPASPAHSRHWAVWFIWGVVILVGLAVPVRMYLVRSRLQGAQAASDAPTGPSQSFPQYVRPSASPAGTSDDVVNADGSGSRGSPASAPAPGFPGDVVAWNDAAQYVGQTVTVQGRVVRTYNTGKVCFINFSHDRDAPFYLIAFADNYAQFPPSPEKFFLNKTVRVTGKVETYNSRFEIKVNSKDQVRIVP